MKPKSSYGLIGNTTKTRDQHLNNCFSTKGILYANTGYTWCHSALFLTESAQPDPSEQVCVMTTAAADCVAVLKGGKHPPSGAYSQWALKEVFSVSFFLFFCATANTSASVLGRVSRCTELWVYKSDLHRILLRSGHMQSPLPGPKSSCAPRLPRHCWKLYFKKLTLNIMS